MIGVSITEYRGGVYMDRYIVYWIETEIAHYFFHKCDVLYRFFQDHENSNDQLLSAQYEYITKDFPHNSLMSQIKNYSYKNNITIQKKGQTIELYKDGRYVALQIDQKRLIIYCQTLHCAEKLIFPPLRLFHSLLFVIKNNFQKYGWISPFIKSNQINKKEKLYS